MPGNEGGDDSTEANEPEKRIIHLTFLSNRITSMLKGLCGGLIYVPEGTRA